jgi:hypothetical protein
VARAVEAAAGSPARTLRGARLDAHDGHVMGDDVVQLAGDPQPLLDDRVLAELARLGAQGPRLVREARSLPAGSPGGLAAQGRPTEVDDVDEQGEGHGCRDG